MNRRIFQKWSRKKTVIGAVMTLVIMGVLVLSWPDPAPNTQVTLEYLGYRSTANGYNVVLLRLKNEGDSPVSYYAYDDGKYPALFFKDSNPDRGLGCSFSVPEYATLQAGETKVFEASIIDLYEPWSVELAYYQGARGGSFWRYQEKITEVLHLGKPDESYLMAKTRVVQESMISTHTLKLEREIAAWKEQMEREWEEERAAQVLMP